MKLGFVNFAKFAAVVLSILIAGSVNAWATCPTSPYYSPDFGASASCLTPNGSAGVLPAGSSTSISAWSSNGTTVTFTTAPNNGLVAGEPVILSGFTPSTFFNTLVFPVLSPTSSSFSVAFVQPPGTTSESGTATPMTVLQLTSNSSPGQAGSAWDNTPQPVGAAFSTTFYFQLSPGGNAGDGFAFVIQNSPAGTAAIGLDSCSMGFGDDIYTLHACGLGAGGITNSVAVAFKTSFTYATGYPEINSVSIQNNLNADTDPNCVSDACKIAENDLNTDTPPGPTLTDSNIHAATVTYSLSPTAAQTNCVFMDANVPCLDVILDGVDLFPTGVPFYMTSLGLTSGNAYTGFTAGTSTNTEAADILSWVFTPAGASTTGNIGPTTPTTFNFQGGYDPNNPDTSGFNFSAVLTNGATQKVKAVLTALPVSSQAACTALVTPTFPNAQCFVYQNGGGHGVDVPIMFELTCPPTGECISNTGDFPAILGSQFPFVLSENSPLAVDNFPPVTNQSTGTLVFPPAIGPFSGPVETTGGTVADPGTGLPSIGVLKGQGPDPIHPCTPYPGNIPALFQSNQVVDFYFNADTSGGAHGSSGDTNSCWVVTYNTQSELPTISVSGLNPTYNVGDTPHPTFTCHAVNNGSAVTGPYLTVLSCNYPTSFDTTDLGPQTYTANVTDSALNTNFLTVTYNVQAPPSFSGGTTAYFTVGTNGPSFGISTTGYPLAALSAGTLPGGLHFTDNHDGTGTISGTPNSGTGGVYSVQITATNSVGAPSETITIYVDQAPAITSANNTTFAPGVFGSFTVTTSGYPLPTLGQTGASGYSWLSFVDNLNGTATLSGTPPTGMAAGSVPLMITASNGIGSSAVQSFTLHIGAGTQSVTFATNPSGLAYTVAPPTGPSATYSSGQTLSLTVGVTYTISVSATPQTLPSLPGTEFTFNNWSDSGAISHTITVTAAPASYTANFNTLYQLTTSATTGGTVSPASGGYYAAGSAPTITASPAAGYTFSGWTSSPGTVASPTSTPTTITMSAPESVKANFAAAASTLLINPTSLDFANVNNNTLSTKFVTLTNQGSTAIKISSITIPGSKTETNGPPDADDFSFVSLCGSSIAPGKSCTIAVIFGADNDYLTPYGSLVITDSATGSPQSVTLTSNILDPLISLSASSMSFGTVTPPAKAAKTVTVKNTGLTSLTLSGLSISGTDFAFTSPAPIGSCTSTTVLAAAGTCTVNVTFSPPTTTKNTNYSGTVTIISNALNGATAKTSLSGTGK